MNKYTLTLAILVLILAGVGVVVSTKLATKRNEITAQIVAEKKKRDDNVDQISKLKITRQAELDELNRLQADWGRQWTTQGAADAQQAQILLNIGTQQGFGARAAEPVYLFALQPDGSSQFLGEFLTESDAQRSVLRLNRKPMGDELAAWPQQGEFRVYDRIPPGVRGTFHDLATNQTFAEQIVINEKAKDQIQQNHIAASQQTLDRRMVELAGDPAAPPTADPEIVKGLVETLRVEEAQRNTVLKDVDALRRKLSDLYARLESVLAENSQAVESLATGTETAATPARPAN